MTDFTYTTYIRAVPGRVWRALTDPADTRRYWRHRLAGPKTFASDWEEGSTWSLVHDEVDLVVDDPEQVVLVARPGRRLAYTWHSFTPDWAAAVGMEEGTRSAWAAEPRSTVTIDLEGVGEEVTKLTLTHGGFRTASSVLPAIATGWPAVLSSLKSLLEAGAALPTS
jgi:uncharacterized protein YndB with AHSA1/START domain